MGLPQIIGGVAGLGLGAIKGNQKRAAYNRDKELAAQTAIYSPWTGMKPEMPQKDRSGGLDDLFGGALTGGMLGEQISSWGKPPIPGQGNPNLMAGGFEASPYKGSAWNYPTLMS